MTTKPTTQAKTKPTTGGISPFNITTAEVRFSYVAVWEPKLNPSNVLKYSACLLLDKENVAEKKKWDAAVQAAIKVGIEKGKFTAVQIPILKTPIRDGDKEIAQELKKPGQGYEGCWFVNASSDNAPEVMKPEGGMAVPIIDPNEFYSGVKGRAIISFYPFNEGGSKGVAVGLNACLKTRDFDRLDGRVNASSAFADIAAELSEEDEGVENRATDESDFS